MYYGLSLGVSDLGADLYLTQLMFGLVEIPARSLVLVLLPYSRRIPLSVFLAVGGGACLLTLTVPAGDQSNMARGTFLEFICLFNYFLIKHFFSQTVLIFRLLWPWWGNLELQDLLPSSIFILQNYSQLFSGTQNLLKSHDLDNGRRDRIGHSTGISVTPRPCFWSITWQWR